MTAREVLDRIPAGHPRGQRPAEERAAELTRQGQPATVVMDLDADAFLVVPKAVS